jgi:hypothetical protein
MATKGARGAFCSDIVSKVYAKHLRKVSGESGKYGAQIGGLALATIAVCFITEILYLTC